jgi:drug/metabolite transporter (DMT)-like permease
MEKVSRLALWANLLVISGTWGSSFVLVKLITESMYLVAYAALRGFVAMTALLAWVASRCRGLLGCGSNPPRLRKTIGHMVALGTTNRWLTNVQTAVVVSQVDSAVVAIPQAPVPLMVAALARERRAGVRS